jgi:hypothetical protein
VFFDFWESVAFNEKGNGCISPEPMYCCERGCERAFNVVQMMDILFYNELYILFIFCPIIVEQRFKINYTFDLFIVLSLGTTFEK